MERMEAVERARESPNCLRPSQAFSLVGDETRVRILEALWRRDGTPVRFSTLYELVETDTSAQFNYHLNRLTGQFVRKTDDGYVLRTAGQRVVRVIVEGSFNAHPSPDPHVTDDACTECGEPVVARYEDEQLSIDCPACGVGHGTYGFPPGGFLDRDWPAVLGAFDRRVRHRHGLARDGVCPECSGAIRTRLVRGDDCCLDVSPRAEFACDQCRYTCCSTVGLTLLDRAPVVSFYRDHGIDVGDRPYWRFDWCVTNERLGIRSTDPWRLTLTLALGDETLTAVLDGALTVVESVRR